ncbi:uncharacterized protein LOC124196415 isoform X2 [Daphnia pulex]|uniref:uncharacterized protein LOC124196415 isoform X2 n=1 Tax=Daphnia pulex TaxID=6669 RepID=UPI001EDCF774|nr:uncharacterized protein LOC124196415 isoform X2 [Daphnia pulex]
MNIAVIFSLLVACVMAAPAANPQFPASYYSMEYPVSVGDNSHTRSLPAITEFPTKHPWAPARNYPLQFNSDFDKWASQYSDMLAPGPITRNDVQNPFYPGIPYRTIPVTEDDAEAKSTSMLTSAANFQMSQWIWRWNIILCLVNPSCPNVTIPSTTVKRTRNGYPGYPSFRVDMETLRAMNQDPRRGVVIPVSFAPQ